MATFFFLKIIAVVLFRRSNTKLFIQDFNTVTICEADSKGGFIKFRRSFFNPVTDIKTLQMVFPKHSV